jgi:dynein heavy chain
VILDPFAGAGTTAKVAKSLGRSNVSVEMSEKYCALIKNKLNSTEFNSDNEDIYSEVSDIEVAKENLDVSKKEYEKRLKAYQKLLKETGKIQTKLFLDENEETPFKALIYTAGDCNYGGRVTDDKDRRTLLCILRRFYTPDFLQEDYKISPSGIFSCPPDGSRNVYLEFIDNLPLVAAPEVFGLHDNATLTKDQNDTNLLLNSIIDTEGGGSRGGGVGGMSKEETIAATAADIASKTPENFDLEYAQLKYPVLWEESMNTVLCQELIRFNNLLSLMRSSLRDIQKAVKGLVVMSSELEVLGNALFVNRIPALWKARSYPSLKPLAGYIIDQQDRLTFFREWLMNAPPPVYWISGFFFTQVTY